MRERRDTRCIVYAFDAVAAIAGAVVVADFGFFRSVGCFLHTNKPNDRQRRKKRGEENLPQ